MNCRNLFAIATIAASLVVSPAVYAATSIHSPVSAMFGKTKTIKVTLVNDSGASMQVKAGDDIVTLESGKPVTLKLPSERMWLPTPQRQFIRPALSLPLSLIRSTAPSFISNNNNHALPIAASADHDGRGDLS